MMSKSAAKPKKFNITGRQAVPGVDSSPGTIMALCDTELADSYERLRRDVIGRLRRLDDPEWRDVADEVEIRVRTTGPLMGSRVWLGWDVVRDVVTRAAR